MRKFLMIEDLAILAEPPLGMLTISERAGHFLLGFANHPDSPFK
jgi:hypothetical protein